MTITFQEGDVDRVNYDDGRNWMSQKFGGDWTEKKLDCIQQYLEAYTKILKKYRYKIAYIDAFAGTGYREIADDDTGQVAFPELTEEEPDSLLAGSVQRSLAVNPPFDSYIFIERSITKCTELESIVATYTAIADRVKVINQDANDYLSDLCRYDWTHHRAVLFLDPFGMQVKWSTIECIAKTKAIDMWLLFPLGIGVARLLKNDGLIRETWKQKLDDIFGTKDWFNEFYKITIEDTLFGKEEKLTKDVDFTRIAAFLIKRLKDIFEKVSENPALLRNSKNNPLFLLAFAVGNPKGAKTAIKIADHLLKRI
jgi:three-Cys-motif partner protein